MGVMEYDLMTQEDGILNPDMSGPSLTGLLPQGRFFHGHLRRVSVLSFCLLSSPEASNMVSYFILRQNKKNKEPLW